jgi:putative flippase GtrA
VKAHLDKFLASKLIRFGAVGGAGFFVNEAALAVAKNLFRMGDHAGWFFGFAVAVTFTWWGNRVFTFHERKSFGHTGILAEWARFVATNSLGAAANFAVYALLIGFAPRPLNVPYLALFFGVLVGLIFNFTLSKKLVFRGSVTPPPAPPSHS